MEISKKIFSIFLMVFALFIVSCGDDDDDVKEPDPLVGTYILSSATLNAEVTFMGNTWPAGSPITEVVKQLLYNDSPCADGANTQIILMENYDVAYGCDSENLDPLNLGTWFVNDDRSALTMNLTIQNQPFPLMLENLANVNGDVEGDATNFPLVDPGDGSLTIANVHIVFEEI
ncbi:hypothetical protein [Echinicola shivajiensis]|uniref:hypothetical protein n=1 Tax=Echinicola shivajiensis TaxID=1035916 RepID=UPI001BFC4488|nr:hypothetical protein [Echinicola shivajiensis]